MPDETSLWDYMMEKAAEYEAKEDELSELRKKEDKAQQQIQVLEQEKADLLEKNKTQTDQASFAFIAKLKDDLCKKDAALNEEAKKKEKILVNAKRKIQKLKRELNDSRANAEKTNQDCKILVSVIPK